MIQVITVLFPTATLTTTTRLTSFSTAPEPVNHTFVLAYEELTTIQEVNDRPVEVFRVRWLMYGQINQSFSICNGISIHAFLLTLDGTAKIN